jgi:uncharacterized protein with HEPN domain
MKRDYKLYLKDIILSIDHIQDFVENIDYDDFLGDVKTQSAVVRQLEVIGEASKNIPIDIKVIDTNIPWKKIAGTRDIIVHEYFGIDYVLVWNIIHNELKTLKIQIIEILNELD